MPARDFMTPDQGARFLALSALLEVASAGMGAALDAPVAEGLLGVPRAPLTRALVRLEGLRVGDQPVVRSVQAFGSRAGEMY